MKGECKKYDDLIELYVLGELSEELTREIDEHIKVCDSCRLKVETAKLIEKSLTPEPRTSPPGFARAVALNISDIAQSKKVPTYGKLDVWWLAPWLAGVTMILFILTKIFAPHIPSLTHLAPRIIANPLTLVASITILLMMITSTISIAIIGIAYQKLK